VALQRVSPSINIKNSVIPSSSDAAIFGDADIFAACSAGYVNCINR